MSKRIGSFNLNRSRRPEATYIDFPPRLNLDKLSTLVSRANSWLIENKEWEVKSCETVPCPASKDAINPSRVFNSFSSQNEIAAGMLARLSADLVSKQKTGHKVISIELIRKETSKDTSVLDDLFERTHISSSNRTRQDFMFTVRVYLDSRNVSESSLWSGVGVKIFTLPRQGVHLAAGTRKSLLTTLVAEKEDLMKQVEQFCGSNKSLTAIGLQTFQVPRSFVESGMPSAFYKRTDASNVTTLMLTYINHPKVGQRADGLGGMLDATSNQSFFQSLTARVTGALPATHRQSGDPGHNFHIRNLVLAPRVTPVAGFSTAATHGFYGISTVVDTGVGLKQELFERFRNLGNASGSEAHFLGAETVAVAFPADKTEFSGQTLLHAYRYCV
ncbi:unnamed protein product, partial [Notodromas monacha]